MSKSPNNLFLEIVVSKSKIIKAIIIKKMPSKFNPKDHNDRSPLALISRLRTKWHEL